MKVCITKVEETGKGPKVFVSRSNRDLIKRLFEMYIPEVASGVIEVMAIAREPGSRTKIAVKSNNPNVDAKGSCVGLQGSRVKQINEALSGERIDIFNWSDNPIILIAEALTPAKVISVLTDETTRKSTVIVPDEQFSLAIGKGGQNVRLASLTTGWKIDIKDETTAYRDGISFTPNVYGY
jgi:N utilization substance protein A